MIEDLARKRFFTLALLRFGGVVLAFVGISIIAKRWIEPSEIVGGALVAVAIVDVMILPMILIRRWRREG
jgi:hypothetical protein